MPRSGAEGLLINGGDGGTNAIKNYEHRELHVFFCQLDHSTKIHRFVEPRNGMNVQFEVRLRIGSSSEMSLPGAL